MFCWAFDSLIYQASITVLVFKKIVGFFFSIVNVYIAKDIKNRACNAVLI